MSIIKYVFLVFALVFSFMSFAQSDSLYSCDCEPDSSLFLSIPEKMAEYPGGTKALLNYLSDNINYPQEAVEKKFEDIVYVSMCIRNTGAITRVKILRGRYEILNNEALRVISKMPKWEPAKRNGFNVCSKYNIPVRFELKSTITK